MKFARRAWNLRKGRISIVQFCFPAWFFQRNEKIVREDGWRGISLLFSLFFLPLSLLSQIKNCFLPLHCFLCKTIRRKTYDFSSFPSPFHKFQTHRKIRQNESSSNNFYLQGNLSRSSDACFQQFHQAPNPSRLGLLLPESRNIDTLKTLIARKNST